MRVFKFRAWNKIEKCMINPDANECRLIHINGDALTLGWDNDCKTYKLVNDFDVEIMQWSGLKDSRGVDIFEGDIVKVILSGIELIGEIIFENAMFKIKGESIESSLNSEIEARINDNLEVVGNIFEHKIKNGKVVKK